MDSGENMMHLDDYVYKAHVKPGLTNPFQGVAQLSQVVPCRLETKLAVHK